MAKTKTYPWDPADHIKDGEDVLVYLQVITEEEYDPDVTPRLLDCIARSKGVAEIASVESRDQDGKTCVTVTTTTGKSTIIVVASEADVDAIQQALSPNRAQEPIAP